MNVKQVMTELKKLGSTQTVKIYRNHGADGDLFGVKIADLKKILSKIKKQADDQQALALELWDTNNSDAMYLASLAADGSRMTKTQLNRWAKSAWWYMLSEHAVPFVAAEHKDAFGIGGKWIKSKQAHIASSGWTTYATAMAVREDEELDLAEVKELLKVIGSDVHDAPNRVRACMNGFVIGVGSYVSPLLKQAKSTAKRIGKVEVNVGKTSCKIPLATEAIEKIESMGRVGKKRTSTKC